MNVCVTTCPSDSYLSSTQECLRCRATLQNCAGCSNSSACLRCDVGYYLAGQCKYCNDTYTNCLWCDSTKCKTCLDGYVLFNNTCSLMSTCNITNCQLCGGVNCLSCVSGFTLSSNSSSCVATCKNISYFNGTGCICPQGTYINQTRTGICVKCDSLNCLKCDYVGCITCITGYFASKGSCLPCGSNCVRCESSSICS